jgi:sigma-B regulation protein RsbU (phosphoserine phosphatase)
MTLQTMASSSSTSHGVLPRAVVEVLEAFQREYGTGVRLWARADEHWIPAFGTSEANGAGPAEPSFSAVEVHGQRSLRVEVVGDGTADSASHAAFLAAVLARLLRQDEEARDIGREIAERYEEITLLYTISEILGSVISLEEAADTILRELTEVLGVGRASLWIHDEDAELLELIAAVGGAGQQGPIQVADPGSVTAAVFRSRRAVILEPHEEYPRGAPAAGDPPRGSFLSVPVSYTPPDGTARTIGVINLIGRRLDEGFSAGDQKLIAAIASQIGAAVENSRLVAQSLRQERMVREMELAHDLQLKLLPSVEQFRGYADVAARCAPADSVGGDFYQLFRLSGDRLGVMIGDVSSHGFGAALIMALTMSATASRASEGEAPAEVLRRAHQTLIGELENTEMYLTLFYGVIDPAAGTLSYSNAGHSHAFHVDGSGRATRLAVTNPPFGIIDADDYQERTFAWKSDSDLLLLFTDGLPDALGLGEVAGVERILAEVTGGGDLPTSRILERIFAVPPGDGADVPPDDRTAVLVRI